jgi:hypothetical protein
VSSDYYLLSQPLLRAPLLLWHQTLAVLSGSVEARPASQLSPHFIPSLIHTPLLFPLQLPPHLGPVHSLGELHFLFFSAPRWRRVVSTTRDQSGSTAEHHDGPCSSSLSLLEVMSCSSFFLPWVEEAAAMC